MVHFVRTQAQVTRHDPAAKVIRARDYLVFTETQELRAMAQRDAHAMAERAERDYAARLAEGLAAGREEARLEASDQMISNVSRTVEYFGRVEQRMVNLVIESTRKIMRDFGDIERARAVVKDALAAVRNQKQVTLRVAPAMVEPLQLQLNDILASYPGVGYVDVVADGRLTADACIVETEIGVVESSIEGQLEALRGAFQKVLGGRT